jgi:hypothetical protein
VFAEITERHSFPILGFSGGAELALGRAKRAAFEEKVPMTSGNSTKDIPFGGSEVDGRDKLGQTPGTKMEIPRKELVRMTLGAAPTQLSRLEVSCTIGETCAPTPQRD